jgi:hypothetical protein
MGFRHWVVTPDTLQHHFVAIEATAVEPPRE